MIFVTELDPDKREHGRLSFFLQSLKQPHSSEEVQKEVEAQVETEMEGEAEAEGTGEALLGAQLDSINSDVLMRFLSDLVRSSKRSRSRLKKGGLRSCFGVRLARIGSFSGLGC